jgi:hypothetical protein
MLVGEGGGGWRGRGRVAPHRAPAYAPVTRWTPDVRWTTGCGRLSDVPVPHGARPVHGGAAARHTNCPCGRLHCGFPPKFEAAPDCPLQTQRPPHPRGPTHGSCQGHPGASSHAGLAGGASPAGTSPPGNRTRTRTRTTDAGAIVDLYECLRGVGDRHEPPHRGRVSRCPLKRDGRVLVDARSRTTASATATAAAAATGTALPNTLTESAPPVRLVRGGAAPETGT